MQLSSDGLRFFHPVDIYPENVVSSAGLLSVLHRLHLLDGFGLKGHQRAGYYSLLHADVAIFWQALRVVVLLQWNGSPSPRLISLLGILASSPLCTCRRLGRVSPHLLGTSFLPPVPIAETSTTTQVNS